MWNWIYALIPFALFCFLAVLFTHRRFGVKITYIAWAVIIAAVSVTHIALFAVDKGNTLLLSLMPVTAYLPVIIAFFALSKRNVVSNVLAVLIGGLCSVSVILINAFAARLFADAVGGAVYDALNFIVLALASAALGFVCFRFLKKVLDREKVIGNKTWYVLPAVFLLLLLSLYQKATTTSPVLIAFLLLTDVCVLAVITAFIVTKFKNAEADAERLAVEKQLAAEREQYGALKTSLETDKRYRHDIRHHFSAIAELACKGSNRAITEYVETLGAKLTDTETKWYCVNNVVNAVLSAFVKRAEELGIQTEIEAIVPDEPPADEYDLCAFIGNALDNAANACEKVTDGERKITATVKCDKDKTVVKITNTTAGAVPMNKDGFPVSERTDEHGYGLSSMRHIAESYGGVMRCTSENNVFTLGAVLFKKTETPSAVKRTKKQTTLYSIAAVPLVLLTAILSLNFMPATVSALEQIPILGKAIEIADFRTWGWQWGDSGIEIQQPETNNPDANEIIADCVKECRKKFDFYFARKYNGYVYSEFTSKEIVNDDSKYVLQMSCVIQAGSSAEYFRYFVADKATGEIVTIDSLFADGSDWNTVVSNEILRQMQAIVEADEDCHFFGFGIWENDPKAFSRLSEDAHFYIDAAGNLIVVFDKYEVAPGKMGSPRFAIPYETIKDILSENSLLKEGA